MAALLPVALMGYVCGSQEVAFHRNWVDAHRVGWFCLQRGAQGLHEFEDADITELPVRAANL
jgi:hypothetical protein